MVTQQITKILDVNQKLALPLEIERLRGEAVVVESLMARNEEYEFAESLSDNAEEIRRHIKHLERVLAVLRAGYDRVTLRVDKKWELGYVEDPRPYKNPWRVGITCLLASAVVFSPIVIGSLWLMTNNVGAARITGVMISMLLALLVTARVGGYRERKNDSALEKAGLPIDQVLYFYKGVIPDGIMRAYREAVGSLLFEEIRILAPRKAFSAYNPHAVSDPIIVGRVGGKWFFIGQFDIIPQ